MIVEIKALESPDFPDLWDYKPDYNYDNTMDFKFLLEMFIGPVGEYHSDLFTGIVCSPSMIKGFVQNKDFLIEHYRDKDNHYLVMKYYNYHILRGFLENYVYKYNGWWWGFIAWKIQNIAKWKRKAKNTLNNKYNMETG